MLRAVATRSRTYLRRPRSADVDEFIARTASSSELLEPWSYPASSPDSFGQWLNRGEASDVEQFLVCRRADDAIAGFVNLNNVTYGALQSAAAGWAAFLPYAGAGHLTEGVDMALELAFTQLRLHRVEANIQPGNLRSRRLAIRSGFELEGYSPAYLLIAGAWRDHERWAVRVDRWRERRRG